MAQVVVGVDVGSFSVHVARLKLGFRTIELEKIVEERVDGDPWAVVAAASAGADLAFTAVAGDAVSMRRMEMPAAAAKRVEQVLQYELDGEIPFEADQMLLDYHLLDKTPERIRLLAVAAVRIEVEKLLEKARGAQVNPREIAAGPLALAGLAAVCGPGETVVLADIGHRRTDLCIVEEGRVAGARTVSKGGLAVTRALAAAFGVPEAVAQEWKHAECYLTEGDIGHLLGDQRKAVEAVRGAVDALIREVRQTLAAHAAAGGREPQKLLLYGGGARLAGLRDYLAAGLQLEIAAGTAPEGLRLSGEHDVAGGAKALALALRATTLREHRVNLRQGDLAFAGAARAGRGIFVHALVCVLAVFLCWGVAAYARRAALQHERESQERELAVLSERLLGRKLQSFGELRTLLAQVGDEGQADSPVPTKDAFDVVEAVSKRIPTTINHDIERLEIRPGRVQIEGRVDNRSDADAIQKALSEWRDCFAKVQLTRTTEAVQDQRYKYVMDIESRCP